MNVVCVLANKKNVKRELKEEAKERKSRDENNRQTERSCLPEKKRRAKNETKIHSFSLSTNWRCLVCFSSSTNTNNTTNNNNNNNNKGV